MIKNRINSILVLLTVFSLIGCVKQEQSKILVSGTGTVLVQPDLVQLSITISHVAQTTQRAKREADIKMQKIMDILKADNIEDKDIKTTSLSYDREMEYSSGRAVLVGQRVQQTIAVTVNDIIDKPDRLPELLDKIAAVDRVVIGNIVFDTKDKTELFRQSRELAYQKALDKAEQYAELSGQKIVKVLAISEERNRDVYRQAFASNVAYDAVGARAASTPMPTGEQEVTTEVAVTFLIK